MTLPPIVPGRPEDEYGLPIAPTHQEPTVVYQPPPQVVYVQQPAAPDPNAGVRQAGTIALWIWIVLTLIPVVLIGGCVLLCLFSGIMGAATDSQR